MVLFGTVGIFFAKRDIPYRSFLHREGWDMTHYFTNDCLQKIGDRFKMNTNLRKYPSCTLKVARFELRAGWEWCKPWQHVAHFSACCSLRRHRFSRKKLRIESSKKMYAEIIFCHFPARCMSTELEVPTITLSVAQCLSLARRILHQEPLVAKKRFVLRSYLQHCWLEIMIGAVPVYLFSYILLHLNLQVERLHESQSEI